MKLWGSSERLENQFSVTHQKWKADKSLFMIQPGATRKSCDFRIRVEQWEHPMTRCQFRFAGRATLDCALQRFYQSEEHSAQSRSACAGMQQDSTYFSLAIPEKDTRAINSTVGPAALTFDSVDPVHLLPDRQRRDAQDQQAG